MASVPIIPIIFYSYIDGCKKVISFEPTPNTGPFL